jgi:cytochrome c peroxidase
MSKMTLPITILCSKKCAFSALIGIFYFTLVSSPAQGSPQFKLSKKCPSTGLYQDHDGYCRPMQPYQNANVQFHGLWKLEDKNIALRPEQIDLGRLLFFDPILSHDQKMSCSTCHDPTKAFSGNRPGLRSSPGLINLAYNPKFFWDGRATTPTDQIAAPLTSSIEMGNSSVAAVMTRLNSIGAYRKLFAIIRPAGNPNTEITWTELVAAIDSFQKSLVTFTAPYDRYILGDMNALRPDQIRGLTLFRSFATRCAECHTPPLFTNHQILTIGSPGESRPFKVPTLRQIGKTAPYMHRGAFKSLGEVVGFYNEGGGRSNQGISGSNTHWHVRPIGLTEADEADLVAFLDALTDDSWKHEIPRDVPSGLQPGPLN